VSELERRLGVRLAAYAPALAARLHTVGLFVGWGFDPACRAPGPDSFRLIEKRSFVLALPQPAFAACRMGLGG
jgi:hypothetical protein